jgi:hypothetical protein
MGDCPMRSGVDPLSRRRLLLTMAQPSVPLSMLLTKDVSYEWHDGVALAAQLVAQVQSDIPNAQSRIPDLRAVTLEENGTLTLSAHPDHAMPAMPGAAQILQQLLSGKDQPAPLRLFAMQAATAEPTPTLDSFADELLKWERPNRRAKLSALYFRALEHIGSAALTEEARAREERIYSAKHDARPAAQAPPKKKKKAAPKDQGSVNRSQAVGLAIIVLALIVGGGAWYMLGRPSPAALLDRVTGTSQPAPPEENAAAGAVPETETPPSTSRPVPRRRTAREEAAAADAEMVRARELFQRQEYAAAGVAFERVVELLGTESSPQAEEVRQVAKSLAEVSRAAIAEQAEAALREYRTGDAGVNDPIPLAYLPPKPSPNTPPEMLQVLEVHVNAVGTVDSAKFVMNRPSFRNSWWTSAAKAWRFNPATKDGKPVRFVMRIVMDDSTTER